MEWSYRDVSGTSQPLAPPSPMPRKLFGTPPEEMERRCLVIIPD